MLLQMRQKDLGWDEWRNRSEMQEETLLVAQLVFPVNLLGIVGVD